MSEGPILRVERLADAVDLPLPAYRSAEAAGLDLCAHVGADAALTLPPGERQLVGTGIRVAIPRFHEGQIRPRSGLALEHGLTVLNAPGTIDSDYRGEVKVLLVNLGDRPVAIRRGMRIAQLVIAPVARATVTVVESLAETARGTGGFGSTGTD